MTDKSLQLKVFRTAVGVQQRALRDDAEKIIRKAMSKPDFKAIVKSRRSAQKEVDAFIDWIDEVKGDYELPAEIRRFVNWMSRNKRLVFGGYNPYLLKMARQAAADIEEANFLDKVKGLANKLADVIMFWQKDVR